MYEAFGPKYDEAEMKRSYGDYPRMQNGKFDSLAEMVRHVESLPLKPGSKTGKAECDSWCMTSTEDSIKLAKDGWSEGARIIAAKASQMVSRLVSRTAKGMVHAIGYDVTGAVYDPGAVMAGQPEAWGTIVPEDSKRAIRIVFNCSASAGVPESVIQNRGIAIASLVWMLNVEGYPVTVDWLEWSDHWTSGESKVYVRLVDAGTGSQIDLDRLAFGLGHPSMFRRLGQAVVDGHRGGTYGWWGSHCPMRGNSHPDCDLYLGGAHLEDAERWRDGGESWVLKEFERQTS